MAGAMGRSRPLSTRLREKRNHPPPDQPWVWLSREMLESEAWRTAPINTRRVIERLMLEHMAHAGTMNGKLVCTFDDFEKWGAWRRRLGASISDAVDRGWIVVTEKGRASAGENRWPTKYALGWLPMHEGGAALNRWKTWAKKSSFPSGQTSTGETADLRDSLVDKLPPAPVDKPPLAKCGKQPSGPSGQTSTTYKILGGGAETRPLSDASPAPPTLSQHSSEGSQKGKNNFGPSADHRIATLEATSQRLKAERRRKQSAERPP